MVEKVLDPKSFRLKKCWSKEILTQAFLDQKSVGLNKKWGTKKSLGSNNFGVQTSLGQTRCWSKTRPSWHSEAATMYKLKGQYSNMRTGQNLENRELARLADPSS